MSGSVTLPHPGFVLKFMAHVTTKDQADACGLDHHLREAILMSKGHGELVPPLTDTGIASPASISRPLSGKDAKELALVACVQEN